MIKNNSLKSIKINENNYYYVEIKKKNKNYVKVLSSKQPTEKQIDDAVKILEQSIVEGTYDVNKSSANIVALLEETQNEFGYLPEMELLKISKELDLPAVDVYGVATFYSYFRLSKPAKYLIKVCDGTACHVRGSPKIMKMIDSVLKIKPGETSKDGLFTLETVRCLGLCASAPLMMVNDKLYPKLEENQLKQIFEDLKNE